MAKKEVTAAPHIGQMLRKYIKEGRYAQSAWARRQGVGPLTVARYLKQQSMRVDTLFTICQAMNYNFFKQISDALPPGLPPKVPTESDLLVPELQQRIRDLEMQNAALKEALSLVGGR